MLPVLCVSCFSAMRRRDNTDSARAPRDPSRASSCAVVVAFLAGLARRDGVRLAGLAVVEGLVRVAVEGQLVRRGCRGPCAPRGRGGARAPRGGRPPRRPRGRGGVRAPRWSPSSPASRSRASACGAVVALLAGLAMVEASSCAVVVAFLAGPVVVAPLYASSTLHCSLWPVSALTGIHGRVSCLRTSGPAAWVVST